MFGFECAFRCCVWVSLCIDVCGDNWDGDGDGDLRFRIYVVLCRHV